jgi:hypothetical protein
MKRLIVLAAVVFACAAFIVHASAPQTADAKRLTIEQLIDCLTNSGIARATAPTALQNLLNELVVHSLLFE